MRAAGPVVDPVPCSGCGKLIDPLRTGHVAIFDQRYHFFCDRGACRASFLGLSPGEQEPAALHSARELPRESSERPAGLEAPVAAASLLDPASEALPAPPPGGDDRVLVEPIAWPVLTEEPAWLERTEPRDAGALLLVIAVVAGALAVALSLAGDAPLVLAARIVLSAVGAAMLLGRAATTRREEADPHPAAVLSPAAAALAVAAAGAFGSDRALGSEAASLAGIVVGATAVGTWLLQRAREGVVAEQAWVEAALAAPVRRAPVEGTAEEPRREPALDVMAGEQVLVEPGEVVPVDLVVAGGEVEVLPWPGATTRVRRRDGEPVVAGARIVQGRIRGVCTARGLDRAFARLLVDPRRRADALASIARMSRALAERWAIVAAVVAGFSAFLGKRAAVEIGMTAVAVQAAFATSVIAGMAGVHVLRGIVLSLRRGVTYKSADAWERAGRVTVATFCARGTLLLGEPELADLESCSPKLEATDVLSLAAGAERAEEHPVATAIVRAARARSVRPDGVRNPSAVAGLGVTAVASTGQELTVGNRALLLEQRVSIAAAEERIAQLEALGRTVVLVALGGRLVGLLGLQDGLRPGARAAVQHLFDAQIEPVLLSGDARETCEAIGRSLDIEHIRPEVLPADRAAEVRRLVEAGASVAVLGHAGIDEAALGAADVAVALGAAGSASGEASVALASDDVRDAALALAIAKRTRLEARVGLALATLPAFVGAATVAVGLLPPAYAPLAALLGQAMAVVHARALGEARDAPAT